MQRIRAGLPMAERPQCPASNRSDQATHSLIWDGWWQSGNPEVVIPRWSCACGEKFTDAPRARWFRGGELGGLFHQ